MTIHRLCSVYRFGLALCLVNFTTTTNKITGVHADTENTCCDKCKCNVTENEISARYFVQCKDIALTKIPANLPNNTSCLDLSDNHINDVQIDRNVSFSKNIFENVTCLSLSNNTFSYIKNDTFNMFPSLRMLDLSLNNIRYNMIDSKAFVSLNNLIFLDIKQNLKDIQNTETYPDVALSHLTNLQTLSMDGLPGQKLGAGFLKFHLTELFLSGSYGRCTIPEIDSTYFLNLQTLSNFSLYLSNCTINHVKDYTFGTIKNLTSLDISWNNNLTFAHLPNITHGLNSIKYVNFNALHTYYQYGTCTKITKRQMASLMNTSLVIMLLETNYMIAFDKNVIFPKTLEYLSIRDNMFIKGKYIQKFYKNNVLANVRYFDTAQMFKPHDKSPWKPRVVVNDNECEETLRQDTVIVKSLTEKCFKALCLSILTQKRQINEFDTVINKLHTSTKHFGLSNRNRNDLVETNVSKSKNMSSLSKIEYLDISETQLGWTATTLGLFPSDNSVQFLNISGNILWRVNKSSLFSKLPNLLELDVSHTNLRKIPKECKLLLNLERLHVGNNKLYISYSSPVSVKTLNVTANTRLKYLDISENQIETIPQNVRQTLDKLTNLTINMLYNPIKCNCVNLAFLEWMINSAVVFKDIDQYTCRFDDASIVVLDVLETSIIPNLKSKCSQPTYHVIILVTSLCLLTFLVILCGGLAYRYKWNLRYLYYMAKFKLVAGYQPIRDDETPFEKDVFVSYAQEDACFVRQKVVEQLENVGNISLLVHGRDFQAGQYIGDNIMKAVTTTRRTLVILTKSYIRSKWCIYEMNMARLEGIDTGRNVLCVLMLENIPTNSLPLEIMDIVRKRTYLEYPHEEQHQDGFWQRLRCTLGRE